MVLPRNEHRLLVQALAPEPEALIEPLGVRVVLPHREFDPGQATHPRSCHRGRQKSGANATMAKRREQAHAKDADVLARVTEGRLDVAPPDDGGILERNVALAVGEEPPIEGE